MRWIPLVVAVLAFPLGVLSAFLATPVLWSLEALLHVELAGHSGPADWLLWASGSTASLVAGLCYSILRGRSR